MERCSELTSFLYFLLFFSFPLRYVKNFRHPHPWAGRYDWVLDFYSNYFAFNYSYDLYQSSFPHLFLLLEVPICRFMMWGADAVEPTIDAVILIILGASQAAVAIYIVVVAVAAPPVEIRLQPLSPDSASAATLAHTYPGWHTQREEGNLGWIALNFTVAFAITSWLAAWRLRLAIGGESQDKPAVAPGGSNEFASTHAAGGTAGSHDAAKDRAAIKASTASTASVPGTTSPVRSGWRVVVPRIYETVSHIVLYHLLCLLAWHTWCGGSLLPSYPGSSPAAASLSEAVKQRLLPLCAEFPALLGALAHQTAAVQAWYDGTQEVMRALGALATGVLGDSCDWGPGVGVVLVELIGLAFVILPPLASLFRLTNVWWTATLVKRAGSTTAEWRRGKVRKGNGAASESAESAAASGETKAAAAVETAWARARPLSLSPSTLRFGVIKTAGVVNKCTIYAAGTKAAIEDGEDGANPQSSGEAEEDVSRRTSRRCAQYVGRGERSDCVGGEERLCVAT